MTVNICLRVLACAILAGCVAPERRQTLTILPDGSATFDLEEVKHRISADNAATRRKILDSDKLAKAPGVTATIQEILPNAEQQQSVVRIHYEFRDLPSLVAQSAQIWPELPWTMTISEAGPGRMRIDLLPIRPVNPRVAKLSKSSSPPGAQKGGHCSPCRGWATVVLPGPIRSSTQGTIEGNRVTVPFDTYQVPSRNRFLTVVRDGWSIEGDLDTLKPTGWPLRSHPDPATRYRDLPTTLDPVEWPTRIIAVHTEARLLLPGAGPVLAERPWSEHGQPSQVTITINPTPPAGRQCKKLLHRRFRAVTDAQGQAVAPYVDDDPHSWTLALNLPPAGTTIASLEVDALCVTQADFQDQRWDWADLAVGGAAIDLKELLPGTTMTVLAKDSDSIQLRLDGLGPVRHLEAELVMAPVNSSTTGLSTETLEETGDAVRRTVTFRAMSLQGKPQPQALILRRPLDLRLDQVRLRLKDIPLASEAGDGGS